jgi:hypothetical protein
MNATLADNAWTNHPPHNPDPVPSRNGVFYSPGNCSFTPVLSAQVPKFTIFIHAPSVQGLARTLRSARIAPDILVVHDRETAVQHLCLRYGARDKNQIPGVTLGAFAMDAFHDWLLLLHPGEELSADTRRALDEWRHLRHDNSAGYLIRCGKDNRPQLRFVNRSMVNWIGEFPPVPTNAGIFPGLIARPDSSLAA